MALLRSSSRHGAAAASLAAALTALAATACVADNEAIVVVAPSIEEPQATVALEALGTDLSGSFQLLLRLGPRASGASQVTAEQFTLTNADQSKTVVPSLEVTSDTTFPVTVDVDSEVRATFTIDLGGSLLPSAAVSDICGAGGLRVTGSIKDSLQDGATPAASAVFQPSGCPEK